MKYSSRLSMVCLFLLSASVSACAENEVADELDDNSEQPDPSSGEDEPEDEEGSVDAGSKPRDAGKPVVRADASTPGDAGTPGKVDAGSALDGGTKPSGNDAAVSSAQPRCVKKPSQVMIIGDSYINWPTHTLPSALATASKQTGWRLAAVGGASMATGGIAGFIPDQFEGSYAADKDVHTVVMDGGGNDILIADPTLDPGGQCKASAMSPSLANCQKIVQTATDRLIKLLARMGEAGVRDVAYFFYPRIPEGTLLGGASPNAINDYSRPKFKEACEGTDARTNGKVRCHFVDMVPVFTGHDDWFFPGDIHPTSAASPAMAQAIWKVMTDNCIGQTDKSTCCAP